MTLLRASPEKAQEFISKLNADSRSLTKTVYTICSYMKNISREEAWALTLDERDIIFKMIKSKFDTMEKSKGQVNIL